MPQTTYTLMLDTDPYSLHTYIMYTYNSNLELKPLYILLIYKLYCQ